jgi:hypothetical protein
MARAIIVFIGCILVFGACNTQKMVCPAYQSAFIHDKEALRKKFSYFQEGDSTPKVLTASRNKYLVAEPVSYKKKVQSLQTVTMKPVNPVVPDSLKPDADLSEELQSLDSTQRNVFDSTAVIRIDTLDAAPSAEDSIYQISKEKEIRVLKYDPMKRQYKVDTLGFNTEQDNYMWYLREYLVLPDVKLSRMARDEDDQAASGKSTKGKKKERGGFFKNLFKKKKKEPVDTTQQVAPAQVQDFSEGFEERDEEGSELDTLSGQRIPLDEPKPEATPKKKKTKTKKKKEPKPAATTTPKEPAKKEEEDDGF